MRDFSSVKSKFSISRRHFLLGFCGSMAGLSACGHKESAAPGEISLGRAERFAEGATLLPLERVVVIRRKTTLDAVSMVCTHQTCLLHADINETEDRSLRGFTCPCHNSKFDAAGNVLQGPAEKPLLRHALRVTAEGELMMTVGERS